MKRLTAISAIIFIAYSCLYSQEKTFGIKGGFTISNFWGDGSENLNNTFRNDVPNLDEQNQYWFAVGIFNTRDLLPDFLAIQTEVLYLRGGKSWEGTYNGEHFSTNVYADYLQLPWLAKITIPVLFRPRVYFGPYLSWMFRAKLINAPPVIATDFTGETVPTGELFERYTNTIDLGLSTGVDFDLPFGPGNFVFDFRYNLGALNVFNVQAAAGLRNYIFLFMAGYAINFGGY